MVVKKPRVSQENKRTPAGPARNAVRSHSPAPVRPPRILTYVDAVARHGSIRKAAEALNIASSALNRRVLDLEQELGCNLFERLPRGVRPTAAGELFVDYVRRTISDLETVTSRIEQLRGLVRGRVKIAAVESAAEDLLPRAITLFQSAHPRVRFDVNIGAPQHLLQRLIKDQADLILTHTAIDDRKVSLVVATRWPLFALIAPDHPLAAEPELRLRDCLRYPIALGDNTLAGRALIEQALTRTSFNIEPALVSNSVEAMKAFSRMNQGICFQFRPPGKAGVPTGGMIAIPVADQPLPNAQLLLATRRGRALPFAAAAFAEQLRSLIEAA
jgi:DNA-binding transcriptional LysR family regulator